MNCKDFDLYASLYIDNMTSEKETIEFEKHINTCKNCKIAFDNLNMIVKSINDIEEVELPENFSNELREKLETEKNHKSKGKLSNKIKLLTSIVAGLLITVMSLSLLNNYLLNQSEENQLDIARVEEKSNTEENQENNIFQEESTDDLSEDSVVEPRIMSMESIDEHIDEDQEKQENQKDNLNNNIKANNSNIIKLFIISILSLGIGLLIYKFFKK